MRVRLKRELVKVTMTRGEADAVRACLFREGAHPSSPAVQKLRCELYQLLDAEYRCCRCHSR